MDEYSDAPGPPVRPTTPLPDAGPPGSISHIRPLLGRQPPQGRGPMTHSQRRLVIQADDMGMHPAVSDGILLAHQAGVVTQASIMAGAPDAGRAARHATMSGLAVGVHLT